jgi:hypothetical protein
VRARQATGERVCREVDECTRGSHVVCLCVGHEQAPRRPAILSSLLDCAKYRSCFYRALLACCLPWRLSCALSLSSPSVSMSGSHVAASAVPAAVQSAHTHLVKTLYRQVIKLQLNWVVDRSAQRRNRRGQSERAEDV